MKKFLLIGMILFSFGKVHAAVFGQTIHSQPTLQSGTTAYPQFLYVGSSATIPSLSLTTLSGTLTDNTTATHSGAHTFSSATVTNFTAAAATVTVFNTNRIDPTNASTNGVAIKGTTAGGNAAAGDYGEYFSTANSASGVLRPTNNAFEDIVSTTLAAGDWKLTGYLHFDGNSESKFNDAIGAMSTTAGNSSAGLSYAVNKSEFVVNTSSIAAFSMVTPTWRQSISSPTTYYLKYFASTVVSNIRIYGALVCERRR